jgi:CRISPR-associated RAMP protein (TIGR02581 family)
LPDYRDFDKLECITQITGEFENVTPLRVGAGREAPLESSVDIAVFRVGGRPCIPGSSLKGVMRSLAEALQKSKNQPVHDPWDKQAVDSESKHGFCLVCGIFGNTELSSHVRIFDSYPLTEENIVFVKPGVSIDREWGSVRQRALFYEEFVKPGVRWDFRMEAVNIRIGPDIQEERGELLYTIIQIFKERGLQVGARKTLGAGLIVLKKAKGTIITLEGGKFKQSGEGWIL